MANMSIKSAVRRHGRYVACKLHAVIFGDKTNFAIKCGLMWEGFNYLQKLYIVNLNLLYVTNYNDIGFF